MNTQRERKVGINGIYDSANGNHGLDVEEKERLAGLVEGDIQSLVEWLNHMVPHLNLPLEASEEELRVVLIDGTILCSILNKLNPGSVDMRGNSEPGPEKIKKFLAAMDDMGLPRFVLADIQQGYMVPVLQCLCTLKAHFDNNGGNESNRNRSRRLWNLLLANTKGMHKHVNALAFQEHQAEVEFLQRTDHSQGDISTSEENSALYGEEKLRHFIDGKHQHGVHHSVISGPTYQREVKSKWIRIASP